MSRLFDGQFSVESITCSPGSAPSDQGPITMLALIKPLASASSATCFVMVGSAGGTPIWGMLLDSLKLYGTNDFGGGPTLTAGDWQWAGFTKASGNVPPEYHLRNVTTAGAWSHTIGGSNVADGTGPIDTIFIGNQSAASGNDFRGSIAALAVLPAQLSSAAVEAACTSAADDLAAASPSWGVLLNQASTATPLTDFTGGGGNQTAISGTSIDADDPPGWSYTITPPVMPRPPLIVPSFAAHRAANY